MLMTVGQMISITKMTSKNRKVMDLFKVRIKRFILTALNNSWSIEGESVAVDRIQKEVLDGNWHKRRSSNG